MRKIILISLLLFCQNVLCQEYKFDSYYEYKSNLDRVVFFFVNSLDSNYFFYGFSYTEGISGYIYDSKKHEFHYYNLTNLDNSVTFEYINSRKRYSFPLAYNEKIQYEYSLIEKDSTSSNLKIEKFKQRKERKNLGVCELQYQNSEYVFHDKIVIFYSHGFFDDRNLEFTNNRLPFSISIHDDNRYWKLALTKKTENRHSPFPK
ncbi:MAG: hypothetical protein V4535_03645 [Bacteroidota bacterium]